MPRVSRPRTYIISFYNHFIWSILCICKVTNLVIWNRNFWFLWKLSCSTWCFSGSCLVKTDIWEHILLKQTQERMFCWDRHVRGHLMLCWSRHLRGCVMFRKNIQITSQTVRGCSCFGSPCNNLLLFACLYLPWICRGKHTKDLIVVLWLVLDATEDVDRLGWASKLLLDQTINIVSYLVLLIGLDLQY